MDIIYKSFVIFLLYLFYNGNNSFTMDPIAVYYDYIV